MRMLVLACLLVVSVVTSDLFAMEKRQDSYLPSIKVLNIKPIDDNSVQLNKKDQPNIKPIGDNSVQLNKKDQPNIKPIGDNSVQLNKKDQPNIKPIANW